MVPPRGPIVARVAASRRALWLLLACAALGGCASGGRAAAEEELELPPVTIGIDDEGRAIDLAVGQRLLVRLPANPAAGLSWVIRSGSGVILRSEGPSYFTQDQTPGGLVGTGGVEVFRFVVNLPGQDDVRFEQRRTGTGAVPLRVVTFRLVAR